MYRPAWQHLVIGGTKLAVTHGDTHKKPKFEKCKCVCNKENICTQLLETLSFQKLRSPIDLHCFLSN